MNVYTERDSDGTVLEGRTIVVAGYGNQGRPQALNLRDSGYEVLVAGRRDGEGLRRAGAEGFRTLSLEEGASASDVLLLLLPDEVQGRMFRERIARNLPPGAALCFAHGFAVAFGEITSDIHDLILVAPKGQGTRLREAYLEGSGLPCLIGVERDASGSGFATALAIARGLGCLRIGAFETSFREEAVSDLFGEQAVLCGGVVGLVKRAFDILVTRGFSPEVAYFECLHELAIIVDLFTAYGFSGMRDMISGTAAFGSLKYGEEIITTETVEAMERLFDRIESGAFAREWLEHGGGEAFSTLRERERKLLVEKVGERVRRLFPWHGERQAGRNRGEGT